MKLKTYVGQNLKEALAQVRKDLGSEAVILSTQSRPSPAGGPRPRRQPEVQVTAALDQAAGPREGLSLAAVQPGWSSWSPVSQIQADLEEMKGLFRQWVREQAPPGWVQEHPELEAVYRSLTRAGVDGRFIRGWLESLKNDLARAGDPPPPLNELAFRYLLDAVEVVDPWKAGAASPRVWTFLGPPGVGKTTTLAKLAVHYAWRESRRVGVICLDQQRLGAQDQLAAYSRVAGLPFKTVGHAGELAQALQQMQDLELILIDTPGRSPQTPELKLELGRMFGEWPGLEHHLVLGATASARNLENAALKFGVLPLASYIITKVDEPGDFSGVFNQLCRRRVPVSYLATGQRVPEDLELATRERLAELLLGSRA